MNSCQALAYLTLVSWGERSNGKEHGNYYNGLCMVSGLEGMEKEMETTIIVYNGTAIRNHSFIPSEPKVSLGGHALQ